MSTAGFMQALRRRQKRDSNNNNPPSSSSSSSSSINRIRPISTLSAAAAITPTALATFFAHYAHHAALARAGSPKASSLAYHESVTIIRRFLRYASAYSVDALQAFTSQPVPAPRWIRTAPTAVPADLLQAAARLLISQLGERGLWEVGGRWWWQWRDGDVAVGGGNENGNGRYDDYKNNYNNYNNNNNNGAVRECAAEWIEVRKEHDRRLAEKRRSNRVVLYVHGGAHYFGSVDSHRCQIQRHASMLNAPVFVRFVLSSPLSLPLVEAMKLTASSKFAGLLGAENEELKKLTRQPNSAWRPSSPSRAPCRTVLQPTSCC